MTRAELIESRGGWKAMAADAMVALINGTARTDTVQPADTEIIITEDTDAPAEAPSADDLATTPAEAPSADDLATTPAEAPSADDLATTPAEAPSADDLATTPAEAVEYVRDGRALAPTVGERLTCDPRVSALIEDARGTVLGSGRKTRLISRRLRRALQRRDDGHCQFPGCAAHKRLHAHHIIHWTNGGPTTLDNLILVCNFHHHVLHEGGWNINPTTRTFTKPDGTTVDPNPSKHSRGSAETITSIRTFDTSAPLAEAENEPFDLGLVLEGLAFDEEESRRRAKQCQVRRPCGPPLPNHLIKQRHLDAYRSRRATDTQLGISPPRLTCRETEASRSCPISMSAMNRN